MAVVNCAECDKPVTVFDAQYVSIPKVRCDSCLKKR